MSGDRLYNFAAVRMPQQRAEMERLDRLGLCVFCPNGLPIGTRLIYRSPSWVVVPNRWPYPDTREHLLVVSRRHVTDVRQLQANELIDLGVVLGLVAPDGGYELRVRSGDMGVTGATVAHLHWHVIVPAAVRSSTL